MNNYFKVVHDVSSVFTDHSLKLKDFNTASISLEVAATDYLYVGFYKPFKSFYAELDVENSVTNEFVFEYYNGSSWVVLATAVDESEGFTKSGFVYFEKPTDWASTSVNSETNFYIRLQPDNTHSVGTKLKGLGILFSNDLDLEGIKSNIVTKLNNGSSWVEKHEAARKMIVQKFRNLGHRKVLQEGSNNPVFAANKDVFYSDLSEFDLLEPFELREASKFYALSMIYLDELSDEVDDKWERNGKRHLRRAEEAVSVFMLKIDVDDDGVEDAGETEGVVGVNLSWQ